MQTIFIKTHRVETTYTQPHFFMLNKGNNSGKPLLKACPNCFVILCNSEEEKERLYWLIMGLWQSKAFYPYLKGSVISFISINDARNCIINGCQIAATDNIGFEESVKQLHAIHRLEQQYKQNLMLIQEAKKILFYRYMQKK